MTLHSGAITETVKKYSDAFQRILNGNTTGIRKAFCANFQDNPSKTFICISTTLLDLMKITSQGMCDNYNEWDKYIKYISQEDAKDFGIPDNQFEFLRRFDKEIKIFHKIIVPIEHSSKIEFTKSYVLYDPKQDDYKYFSLDIANEEKRKILESDKEERKNWIEGVKKKICENAGEKNLIKFPEQVEEVFTSFIEKFEYKKRIFMINNCFFTLWPHN